MRLEKNKTDKNFFEARLCFTSTGERRDPLNHYSLGLHDCVLCHNFANFHCSAFPRVPGIRLKTTTESRGGNRLV